MNEDKEYFEYDILNNRPTEYKDDDYYRHRLIIDLPESKDEMPFIVLEFYEHINRTEGIALDKIKFNLNKNLKYTMNPDKNTLWYFNLASEAKDFIKNKIIEYITDRCYKKDKDDNHGFNYFAGKPVDKAKKQLLQWKARN